MDSLTVEEKIANYETMKHIHLVGKLLHVVAADLLRRADEHDASKLESPEVEAFAKAKPLEGITYGSKEFEDEKKTTLASALSHHYAKCDHHVQHFKNGIKDMHLIQVIELFVDWMASCRRHADGNIRKSLEINAGLYNICPQLVDIMENTIPLLEGVS